VSRNNVTRDELMYLMDEDIQIQEEKKMLTGYRELNKSESYKHNSFMRIRVKKSTWKLVVAFLLGFIVCYGLMYLKYGLI